MSRSEIAHLGGRQVVVENDHVGPGLAGALLELVGLALADVVGRADARLRLQHAVNHDEHGSLGEPGELVDGILSLPEGGVRQNEADEQRALPRGSARVAHGAGVVVTPVRRSLATDVVRFPSQPHS